MSARWDAVDARKRRPPWSRVLVVALLLVSAWVVVSEVGEMMRYKRVLWNYGYGGTWTLAESRELIGKGLNEREKFLLFGDLSQPSRSGQMRGLWDSAPANPAYYAAYAFAYRSENQGAFPPDFLEMAQRLDSDNSWFTYHAAGAVAHDSVKRQRQSLNARKAGEAPSWEVVDGERLNQALALLRTASTQKNFGIRSKEFITERVPLLPQYDRISHVISVVLLLDYFGLDYDMRFLADAVAAEAWLLGEAGDAAGFKQLLGDADAFVKRFAEMKNPTLVDGLVLKANVDRLIWNLHAAAEKLELTDETTRLGRIKERLRQWSEERSQRWDSPEYKASKMRCGRGNEWCANIEKIVKSPPPLTDADLKPGRMFEHLFASRICSLAVWGLLGLGILAVAVFRFCLPAWMLKLAQRMNELLLPVDWAWMLSAGVLLPFGYVTVLTRLTPLGGQDLGLINGGGSILLLANFLTLSLLLLVVPVLIACWRLGLRAAALGICSGTSRLGWLAVLAGLLFVPALAMMKPPVADLEYPRVLIAAVLLVPLVLVILNSLVRALAMKFTRQFSRAVVALTLLPIYACGMLLIMMSMPIYKAAQSSWERRDAMTELTSNGITRYEAAVADELMAEVREVLELDAVR